MDDEVEEGPRRTGGVEMAERLAGGVWGHLVGDALGVPYEFLSSKQIQEVVWGKQGTHAQKAGTWSDDGGLMLALLDSLLSAGFDLEDQGYRALAWWEGPNYKPGELFDIGHTTTAALKRLQGGVKAFEAGGMGEGEQSNGSLMRILPVALVGRKKTPQELAEQAMAASAVTHRRASCRVTCALYCLIAQALLEGEEREQALGRAVRMMEEMVRNEDLVALRQVMTYKERSGSGYVLDSFWSAWDAFARAENYREVVERAVRYGNDTDTTACVAGGLAGIYWGVNGIPSQWVQAMRGQGIVSPLVRRLVEGLAL